jgi:DNA-binding NarL/FixJ family response regulator
VSEAHDLATQGDVIKVYLVDDHALVRRGLRSFLELASDIEISGEASNGREAVDELTGLIRSGNGPDVVLMDLVMPVLDGVGATTELRRLRDAPRIVMLSSFGESRHLRAALQAGVSGYLLKDTSPENVVAAVRSAHRGQLHLDAALSSQLSLAMSAPIPPAALTLREREVVALIAQGMSNDDIAAALFISERTARTHVSHLLGKLGLDSRIQLALWAIDRDYLRVAN